ncbi:MAG: DUF4831 family protein [Prevotella sp.]|nr:DUF4831 family protein [Prevotella sp.]
MTSAAKSVVRPINIPSFRAAWGGFSWAWGGLLFLLSPSTLLAQTTDYYLPKTVMRFTVKVEKTDYTPGKFAQYTGRYLKKNVGQEPTTTYRLLGMDMVPLAQIDTAKHFNLLLDKKHSITKVARADNGQLLAINADAQSTDISQPSFTPAPKPQPLNPNDFMSEDILNAGSMAKMAELTAKEIYDIRDSRNQLSRGEADFMPKDGAQLKMMLANLDRQEQGLSQLFEGVVTRDTAWTTIDYLPTKEGQEVLFRFSKHFGLVDSDDLSGEPYYIVVKDLHSVAAPEPAPAEKKEDKNDIGLRVSQPSKIKVSIINGIQTVNSYELLVPQFGTVQPMSGELFGKKQSSEIVLDPLTGSVRSIKTIPAE